MAALLRLRLKALAVAGYTTRLVPEQKEQRAMAPQIQETLPPAVQVSQMMVSQWMSQAIRAAAELGIGDALADGPLTSAEVSERLATDPDATHRLLIALMPLDLVEQSDDGFELTESGRCLVTGSPTSIHAWVRLLGSGLPAVGWGALPESVRTGQMASKLQDGRPDTDSALWDELAADPEAAETFHRAMYEITRDSAPPIAAAIDFNGARRVVDVGGGAGGLLCAVLDVNPHLEGVVLDLAPARLSASKLFAERGLADRASFVAGDFFESPLPPADVYLMKNVIHDWDDAHAHRILDNWRRTTPDGARLMVVEAPLPEQRSNSTLDWFLAFADLNVMVNNGGRERTEGEYRELLTAAGLEVTGIHDAQLFSVIEATSKATVG
jgi:O-methyltransferase domain/Dimerisation domain